MYVAIVVFQLIEKQTIYDNHGEILHVFKIVNASFRIAASDVPQSFELVPALLIQELILAISLGFLGFVLFRRQIGTQLLQFGKDSLAMICQNIPGNQITFNNSSFF